MSCVNDDSFDGNACNLSKKSTILPRFLDQKHHFSPVKPREIVVVKTVQKFFEKLLTLVWPFDIMSVHTVTLNKNTH